MQGEAGTPSLGVTQFTRQPCPPPSVSAGLCRYAPSGRDTSIALTCKSGAELMVASRSGPQGGPATCNFRLVVYCFLGQVPVQGWLVVSWPLSLRCQTLFWSQRSMILPWDFSVWEVTTSLPCQTRTALFLPQPPSCRNSSLQLREIGVLGTHTIGFTKVTT